MSYQVTVAGWAVPPALAVEHVRKDKSLCLVYSTTLPLGVEDLKEMCAMHEVRCPSD